MKSFLNPVLSVAACLCLAGGMAVQAQEGKTDVSGTWSWTQQGRGGGEPRKSTLVLKADGENLTGKLTTPGRQGGQPRVSEIAEGKVKDGEITFKINRQRQDTTIVLTYSAKVSGDSLAGTVSFERNGETRSREWSAMRETEPKKE